MSRVFILSPANCNGRRAQQALSPNATFAVARSLQSDRGAELGEVFSFVSGLYFRGKLTYAQRFAAPPEPDNAIVGAGVLVITSNAGLRSPETLITSRVLKAFAGGDLHAGNSRYRKPLERSAAILAR